MAGLPKIQIGYRVGKLSVLSETAQRKNGYTVWRCGCECGGEIMLDTRCLQRGTVTDCGCETKVRPGQKDLTGRRFGKLVCLEPTQERGPGGGTIWRCKCDCGEECLAVSTQLTQGYKKSCGCIGRPPLKDFVGRRFGMLTVKEYVGKRNGMHRWRCICDCGREVLVGQTRLQSGKTKNCGCHGYPPLPNISGERFGRLTVVKRMISEDGTECCRCQCDCGKETVVRYSNLVSGHTKSCGCIQKERILANLRLVDGTSVTILEAAKNRLIASNTSGYNGVYRNKRRQKWIAQITFKGKTYYLGSYDHIEDAVKARQRGEEMYDEFLEEYYAEQSEQTREPDPKEKGE